MPFYPDGITILEQSARSQRATCGLLVISPFAKERGHPCPHPRVCGVGRPRSRDGLMG